MAGGYVILVTAAILIVYTFIEGGFFSTAIAWFPILPLFAIFYSGIRFGLVIASILILDLGFLYYAHNAEIVPIVALTDSQLSVLYLISISAVLFILLALAILYVAWQNAVHKELLTANTAKNEFLSGVSHELRTPLNSILGFSDVLQQRYMGELNPKQSEYVEYIQRSGDHLLALVNDLLDIGKIDSGNIDFNPAPTNVPQLLESVITLLSDRASRKRVSLYCSVSESLDKNPVSIDEMKIRQTLINLLANAVAHTPDEGQVNLHGEVINKFLRLTVSDTGPGIPNEYHDKIFERFFQVNNDTDGKSAGTGLGLAISRRYVELHGGTLTLEETAETSGCYFVCEIPLKIQDDPA